MAWLLLIFIIPFVGLLLFLVLGRTKIGRRRDDKQAEVNALIAERTLGLPTLEDAVDGPGVCLGSVATLNRNLGALPVLGGNRIDLLPDYDGSIAAMCAEIEAAQRFVHVEFYIPAWDDATGPFFDALERAVKRGVVGARAVRPHRVAREPGLPGVTTR